MARAFGPVYGLWSQMFANGLLITSCQFIMMKIKLNEFSLT